MSWNHRVMKSVLPDGDESYGIHEVYYNDDGTIYAYTEEPVDVVGDDLEGLRWTLQRMLHCLQEPVLDHDTTICIDYGVPQVGEPYQGGKGEG